MFDLLSPSEPFDLTMVNKRPRCDAVVKNAGGVVEDRKRRWTTRLMFCL